MYPATEINALTPERIAARKKAKKACYELNAISADQIKLRKSLYQQLFAQVSTAYIEPHFFCDYGSNIYLGEKFYANHNCIILDEAKVTIGNRVMLGPQVQIYTTNHALDADERTKGTQYCAPVVIEDDCWIGGGVIILPGVHIGKSAVIGAGSLVNRDIPDGVVAVGNPVRILRDISSTIKKPLH
jgi:maltose O-acetyltransferase